MHEAETTQRPRRRVVAWVVVVGMMVALGGGAWTAYDWFDTNVLASLPTDLSSYRTWRPRTSCRVRAASGEVVDEFWVERRFWVSIDTLPDHVWQAFISAEDRRFFEHKGVDVFGIARALAINLIQSDQKQGGSTLTQQLVKNLIVGKERSYVRKAREAVLARRLERELGKRAILELYLNYVALGSGNYGVEAASRDYFGVGAAEIDVGQAALLAGLVPAPSRYSPRSDPEVARERRRLTLRAMVRDEVLGSAEAEALLDDPVLVPRTTTAMGRPQAAYITVVRREIRRLLGVEAPFDLGIQVRTPLDLDVQRAAQAAIQKAVAGHLDRQGPRLAVRRPVDRAAFLDAAEGLAKGEDGAWVAPVAGACVDALVVAAGKLQVGPFTYPLAAADRTRKVWRDALGPPEPFQKVVAVGEAVRVCLGEDGALHLPLEPWAEGAAVVLDHRTGEVVALIGGRQDALEGFVRAVQARRQPGSSFKPYVYAAALTAGMSQRDIVVDAPLSLPGASGVWSPKNYGGGYFGRLPLRTALAKSLNTVAVRLILDVGPARVAELASAAGVRTPLRLDPTLALGSSEVTPMDQAVGYATLVRGGVRAEPVLITSFEASARGVRAAAGDCVRLSTGDVCLPGGPQPQVVEPGAAYEITDMLREVVRAGTARRAYRANLDRGGKTGTTNGFVDAWFVGFTATHVVAVWIGTDSTVTLGDSETGGKAALPAWMEIVDALPDPGTARVPAPPETVWEPFEGRWVAGSRDRPVRPAHAEAGLPVFP